MSLHGQKNPPPEPAGNISTLSVLCDPFWVVEWPFQRLSDLPLGDKNLQHFELHGQLYLIYIHLYTYYEGIVITLMVEVCPCNMPSPSVDWNQHNSHDPELRLYVQRSEKAQGDVFLSKHAGEWLKLNILIGGGVTPFSQNFLGMPNHRYFLCVAVFRQDPTPWSWGGTFLFTGIKGFGWRVVNTTKTVIVKEDLSLRPLERSSKVLQKNY